VYNKQMSPRQSFVRAEPDARRQSLIEACAHCLATLGASGTSVRAICTEAGVSPGLLRHYFSGIDALVSETYRWTGAQVAESLYAAVAQADPTPRARLLAYLTASFRPPIASPDLLATWLAFWSLTKTDRAIAAVHADIYRDYREGLETLISAVDTERRDHRLTAVALTALIDGLWLELSLGSAPFTPDEAALLAERWLDALLG
jgi:AcrR family transcriptional regulator